MQSMTDKKRDFETVCAAAVKAKNFTEAVKAASGAADCAEILASRTTGVVSEAYAKEVASWRQLAKKLEGRKNGVGGRGAARAGNGDGASAPDGDEWLVAEKPNVTFDGVARSIYAMTGSSRPYAASNATCQRSFTRQLCSSSSRPDL